MDVITVATNLSVGSKFKASEANLRKADLDAIVRRIGARATTNATQAIASSTATTLNNGGTAAWTATEDSGGFVSAVGGTTVPIAVPSSKAGLYVVGVKFLVAAASTGRIIVDILVNGTTTGNRIGGGYQEAIVAGSVVLPLNATDTLGLQGVTTGATNISAGSQIYCYRIGD